MVRVFSMVVYFDKALYIRDLIKPCVNSLNDKPLMFT